MKTNKPVCSPPTRGGKNRFSKTAKACGFTTAAFLFSSLVISPAAASPVTADANAVAEIVNGAAPDAGAVVASQEAKADDSIAVALPSEIGVEIPEQGAAPVTISTGGSQGPSVTLPAQVGSTTREVADDGTVVFAGAPEGVDLAIQALDSGAVRMQTIISDAQVEHDFAYTVDSGFDVVMGDDGTVAVMQVAPGEVEGAFVLDHPWAVDADGQAVPTHYEVQENTIVQIVEPDPGTEYPVVADPQWVWVGAAYGALFTKAETRDLASYAVASGFCNALPVSLRPACFVVAADWLLAAVIAKNNDMCVFIAAVPAPMATAVGDSRCY